VDRVGEGLDCTTQEIHSIHLSGVIAEFDVGELLDAVDCQEHVELALGKTQLADINVDIADGRVGELAALGCLVRAFGQAGDAVSFQAAMQA
jgi:hypothetical protein